MPEARRKELFNVFYKGVTEAERKRRAGGGAPLLPSSPIAASPTATPAVIGGNAQKPSLKPNLADDGGRGGGSGGASEEEEFNLLTTREEEEEAEAARMEEAAELAFIEMLAELTGPARVTPRSLWPR